MKYFGRPTFTKRVYVGRKAYRDAQAGELVLVMERDGRLRLSLAAWLFGLGAWVLGARLDVQEKEEPR